MAKKSHQSISDLLRLPAGPVDLGEYDSNDAPGYTGKGKDDAPDAMLELEPKLDDLQERLFAEGKGGGTRNLLLVMQGMDTSGKGGVIRHAAGLMDPQGLRITSFKVPTEEERKHDFLWRIRNALPGAGIVGIFDRSQYEDVLIHRVRKLSDEATIEARYGAINDFEAELVAGGTTVVKCMLHVSAGEQKQRLLARLDDPAKYWKYNPGDVDERALWKDYQEAYEIALARCNTPEAPWYVVPSDKKWYRNWAITKLLVEHLEQMDPQWPKADFDVEVEKTRLQHEKDPSK